MIVPEVVTKRHQHDVVREQGRRSSVLFEQQIRLVSHVPVVDRHRFYRIVGVLAGQFAEIKVETHLGMRTARMLDGVDVKGLIVRQHVAGGHGVVVARPVLAPNEVAHLLLRHPLFPGVVDALDDGGVQSRRF